MKKTNESGRSMIEMLGVLAVIGVLSTIGILGYRRAMNNHNANETASDVMKMAVWVSGQRMLAQTGNIDGFKKRSPYNITLSNADGANTTFTLTAEQIPESVCEKLTNMNWTLPVISPETCSGTADMTFTFNNDLKKGQTEEEDEIDNRPDIIEDESGNLMAKCLPGTADGWCTDGYAYNWNVGLCGNGDGSCIIKISRSACETFQQRYPENANLWTWEEAGYCQYHGG